MNRNRNFFFAAVLCVLTGAVAPAQGDKDKGAVVAKVNGVSLYMLPVFRWEVDLADKRVDRDTVDEKLQAAINRELVRQDALAEGLDEDPEYLDRMATIGKQLEEAKIHQLGRLYKESIPEMRAARNPEISDEEIDNFILENPKRFGKTEGEKLRRMVKQTIASQGVAPTYADILRERLKDVRFTVDGEPVAGAVIERCIEAQVPPSLTVPSQLQDTAYLLTAIQEMVVPGESDPDVIREKLAAVTLEAAGQRIVLGEHLVFEKLLNDGIAGRPRRLVFFNALVARILAAEARKDGLHDQPAFQAWVSRIEAKLPEREANVLVALQYERHGAVPGELGISDDEVQEKYDEYRGQGVFKQITRTQALASIRRRLEKNAILEIQAMVHEDLRKTAKIKVLLD